MILIRTTCKPIAEFLLRTRVCNEKYWNILLIKLDCQGYLC